MAIAQEREARINGEITAREIRLVGMEGEQIGVVSLREAMALAEENDVDLVEISPTAQPPVCKLMDYGKFKYEQSKKRHEAKLKQKQVQIKEIKFRPGTDDGDYNVKLRNLIRFLNDGDKAKITLRSVVVKWLTRISAWRCSSALKPIWRKLRQLSSFPSWKVVKW